MIKIFVINPGSTSTKLSYFEDQKNVVTTDVFHDSSELLQFASINDQLDFRMEVVYRFIEENQIDLSDVDVIMARGGGCYPIEGGIYEIDQLLIDDTRAYKGNLYHASMLGVQMAQVLQRKYGGQMYMMDPPVLDEYQDLARLTGVEGVYRHCACHALNLKGTARIHAKKLGKHYEDCNFVVCHIDGGITIMAYEKGRLIDGNDGGGGEGPFTPTRMGSMAITDIREQLDHWTKKDFKDLCSQAGGFSSYFGTSDSDKVHAMKEAGDPKATLVWDTMIYQVCKWIGMMSTVLKGKVDGILLAGGLLRFQDVYEEINERCGWIAPVSVYVGEVEQEALAAGAMRVLRGEEKPKKYQGAPDWKGFPFMM